jgi:hypothetical protein
MTAINHIPKGSDDEVKKLVVFLVRIFANVTA